MNERTEIVNILWDKTADEVLASPFYMALFKRWLQLLEKQ
jgi:hypothetical protein